MPTYDDLQLVLDDILQSSYKGVVRSLGDITVTKSGGDEKYFNMSPVENFVGRLVNLTVSHSGEFRLGASFGRIRHREQDIKNLMRQLTGNAPEYGTTINNELRDDILRCTMNTNDRHSAANLFTRFYDLTEDMMKGL